MESEQLKTKKEVNVCCALSNLITIVLQNSSPHNQIEENEGLKSTLQLIEKAIIATDIEGNITILNQYAEKLSGYYVTEIKEKPLTEVFMFYNSNSYSKVKDPVSKVISCGTQICHEDHTLLINKNNKKYQVIYSASPFFNKTGEIAGVVMVIDNLNQEQSLQDVSQTSEDSLIKAELMGGFGNWEIDLNTNKINGSPGALSIYGIEGKELELKYVQSLPLTEYRQILDESLFNLIKENKPYDLEFKIKRPDGKIRDVHSTAIYDAKSKKVFGIIHDITVRKQAEEALKESERKYREFFMKDLTGDFLSAIDGKIIDCNPAFLSFLGYSELIDVQQYPATKFYSSPKERQILIEQIKLKKEVRNYEINMVRSDGEKITVIANVFGIFNEEGQLTHIRGYVFDITDRKKAEENMMKAKEKAEAADRMKTEFLAQMSHEIRSPLNAVLSFTSIVKEITSGMNSNDLETSFSGIESASKRIIRTVDSILNMSDLQLGTYQVSKRKLDVVTLLRILVAEFENIARDKKIGLRFKADVDKKLIHIDEYALSQIVANLLDNAIKYTRKGFVEVIFQVKEKMTIKIKDTGIGISEDYLPKLFTPFTQEEQGYTRSYDGNGLGLALVKKYCEVSNADVSVESEKNIGTIFTITLNI